MRCKRCKGGNSGNSASRSHFVVSSFSKFAGSYKNTVSGMYLSAKLHVIQRMSEVTKLHLLPSVSGTTAVVVNKRFNALRLLRKPTTNNSIMSETHNFRKKINQVLHKSFDVRRQDNFTFHVKKH